MAEGLIHSLFDKTIDHLTKWDIESYFESTQRETDIIEFKSYVDEQKPNTTKDGHDREKLNDIIRTICGFLNSDGFARKLRFVIIHSTDNNYAYVNLIVSNNFLGCPGLYNWPCA